MFKSAFAVAATLVSLTSSALNCDVYGVLRPIFTEPELINSDTLAWCNKYGIECQFAIKVSSPDFDNTTAQVQFLRNYGHITRVGIVVEDITKIFAVNKSDSVAYYVIDPNAAKTTLNQMKARLLGSSFTAEVSALNTSTPFMILNEITYMNYFGNAFSTAPYRNVYETINNSSAFTHFLVSIGKDEFLRDTATTHNYFLANWFTAFQFSRDYSQSVIDYQGNGDLILKGQNYTGLGKSNSKFLQDRFNANITDFEQLNVMESGMIQIYKNLNVSCSKKYPIIQQLIDGVINGTNGQIGNGNNQTPGDGNIGSASVIGITLASATFAVIFAFIL